MSDHKYYDDKGNVILSLDTSYPFTDGMALDTDNKLHRTWTIKDGMYEGQMFATGKAFVEPNILFSFPQGEVLRIEKDGRIFWKQREIEGDDEFRAAMMEVRDVMVGIMRGER